MEIRIGQGHTKKLKLSLLTNGEPYELQPGEEIIWTVKKGVYDPAVLIRKSGLSVTLLPEDTASLAQGNYVYDIVLTRANGDVFPVLPPNAGSCVFEVIRGVYDG